MISTYVPGDGYFVGRYKSSMCDLNFAHFESTKWSNGDLRLVDLAPEVSRMCGRWVTTTYRLVLLRNYYMAPEKAGVSGWAGGGCVCGGWGGGLRFRTSTAFLVLLHPLELGIMAGL